MTGLFDTYHRSLKLNGEFMEKYLVKHGEVINDFSRWLSV
jgi:hypothetical protein